MATWWALSHCGIGRWTWTRVCSAAIPGACGDGRARKGTLWVSHREGKLWTSAYVTYFPSFNSSLEQKCCSTNVFTNVCTNLKEILDYNSQQLILILRNIVLQPIRSVVEIWNKLIQWNLLNKHYSKFIKCNIGYFQESFNWKRNCRLLTAYLPVLTNYSL